MGYDVSDAAVKREANASAGPPPAAEAPPPVAEAGQGFDNRPSPEASPQPQAAAAPQADAAPVAPVPEISLAVSPPAPDYASPDFNAQAALTQPTPEPSQTGRAGGYDPSPEVRNNFVEHLARSPDDITQLYASGQMGDDVDAAAQAIKRRLEVQDQRTTGEKFQDALGNVIKYPITVAANIPKGVAQIPEQIKGLQEAGMDIGDVLRGGKSADEIQARAQAALEANQIGPEQFKQVADTAEKLRALDRQQTDGTLSNQDYQAQREALVGKEPTGFDPGQQRAARELVAGGSDFTTSALQSVLHPADPMGIALQFAPALGQALFEGPIPIQDQQALLVQGIPVSSSKKPKDMTLEELKSNLQVERVKAQNFSEGRTTKAGDLILSLMNNGQPVASPEQLSAMGVPDRPEAIEGASTLASIVAAAVPLPGLEEASAAMAGLGLKGVGIPLKFAGKWGNKAANAGFKAGSKFFSAGSIMLLANPEGVLPALASTAKGIGYATLGKGASLAAEYGGKLLTDAGNDLLNGSSLLAERGFVPQLIGRTAQNTAKGMALGGLFGMPNAGDPAALGQSIGQMGALEALTRMPGTTLQSTRSALGDSAFVRRGADPKVPTPGFDYGTDPSLDKSGAQGLKGLDPKLQEQVNGIKTLLNGKAEVYVVPDDVFNQKVARQAGINGMTPDQVKAAGVTLDKGPNGIPQVFLSQAKTGQALYHEAGHALWAYLPDESRSAYSQAFLEHNDPDLFLQNYIKHLTGSDSDVAFDSLPTEEQVRKGAPFGPAGLTREVASAEMGAEGFGRVLNGQSIGQLSKDPSLFRRMQFGLGRTLERLGVPSVTPEAQSILGVKPSFTSSLILDQFLRKGLGAATLEAQPAQVPVAPARAPASVFPGRPIEPLPLWTTTPQGPSPLPPLPGTRASATTPETPSFKTRGTGPAPEGAGMPRTEARPFVPSKEWQHVPPGTAVPPGGHYRMNMDKGTTEARWDNPPPPEPTPAGRKAQPAAAASSPHPAPSSLSANGPTLGPEVIQARESAQLALQKMRFSKTEARALVDATQGATADQVLQEALSKSGWNLARGGSTPPPPPSPVKLTSMPGVGTPPSPPPPVSNATEQAYKDSLDAMAKGAAAPESGTIPGTKELRPPTGEDIKADPSGIMQSIRIIDPKGSSDVVIVGPSDVNWGGSPNPKTSKYVVSMPTEDLQEPSLAGKEFVGRDAALAAIHNVLVKHGWAFAEDTSIRDPYNKATRPSYNRRWGDPAPQRGATPAAQTAPGPNVAPGVPETGTSQPTSPAPPVKVAAGDVQKAWNQVHGDFPATGVTIDEQGNYHVRHAAGDEDILSLAQLADLGLKGAGAPVQGNTLPGATSARAVDPTTAEARTTWFGLNPNGSNDLGDVDRQGRNLKGYFGDETHNQEIVGASLPWRTLAGTVGDFTRDPKLMEAIRKGDYKVRITGSDGKTVDAKIVDVGPAEWTRAGLDVTYATGHALGLTDASTTRFQIIGPDGKPLELRSAPRDWVPKGGQGAPGRSSGPSIEGETLPTRERHRRIEEAPGLEEPPAARRTPSGEASPEAGQQKPVGHPEAETAPAPGDRMPQTPTRSDRILQEQRDIYQRDVERSQVPEPLSEDHIKQIVQKAKDAVATTTSTGKDRSENAVANEQEAAGNQALLEAHAASLPSGDTRVQRGVDPDTGRVFVSGSHLVDNDLVHSHLLVGVPQVAIDHANTWSSAIDQGKAVTVTYRGATASERSTVGEVRTKEYAADPAAARAKGESAGTEATKQILPLDLRISGVNTPGDKALILHGLSPDKLTQNFSHIRESLDATHPAKGMSDEQFASEVGKYIQNHAHGYRGDGTAALAGTADVPVRVDPAYEPQLLGERQGAAPHDERHRVADARAVGEVINGAFNSEIAQGKGPKAERALGLAEANQGYVGEGGETNPLRERLNKLWTEKKLVSPFEDIRADNVIKFHGPQDKGPAAIRAQSTPVTKALEVHGLPNRQYVSGGFMPMMGEAPRTPREKQAGRNWLGLGTRSSEFKKWFGDWEKKPEEASKVVDKDGNPLRVYHGTTHDFDAFDRSKSHGESDWGKGFYFSNAPEEVASNYSTGSGGDLQNHILDLGERIAEKYRGMDTESIKEAARSHGINPDQYYPDYLPDLIGETLAKQQLVGGNASTIPAYLSIKKPFQLGLGHEEYWNLSKTEGFLKTLESVVKEHGGDASPVEKYRKLILDKGGELYAGDVVNGVKRHERLADAGTDEKGEPLGAGEAIRKALQKEGYDGIIDRTIDAKYGMGRQWNSNKGVTPDTTHYIAFDPTQIKSTTGNRGTFNSQDPRIAFMPFMGERAAGFPEAEREGRVFLNPYDKKKRFEVSDKGMTIHKLTPGETVPLGEAITHPELFKNYPFLKDVEVKVDPSMKNKGEYWGGYFKDTGKGLELTSGRIQLKSPDKKTLVHEIQHAIQYHEGLDSGADPTSKNYLANAGEIEARKAEKRSEYSPEKLQEIPPYHFGPFGDTPPTKAWSQPAKASTLSLSPEQIQQGYRTAKAAKEGGNVQMGDVARSLNVDPFELARHLKNQARGIPNTPDRAWFMPQTTPQHVHVHFHGLTVMPGMANRKNKQQP